MNFWSTRNKSIKWLSEDFTEIKDLIKQGYKLLDDCMDIFEMIGLKEDESDAGKFARVCGGIIVKSRNLSLACYSLSLDGLAQESGAILRPLIETFELLVYLRQDYNRVEEVISQTLPSAGKIAQEIEGFHQNIREHLNYNSSHFNFTYDSMRHVINFKTGKFKRLPTQEKKVFLTNLRTLNAYQIFVLMESISCLFVLNIDAEELAIEADKYRDKCVEIFKIVRVGDG